MIHATTLSMIPVAIVAPAVIAQPDVTVTPSSRTAYQPITLDLDTGETLSETGSTNPFLQRRLIVTFTAPSGDRFEVPGFFAGDGTGPTATSHTGSIFRIRFTPDEPGTWTYEVSYRSGNSVAVNLSPTAGTAQPSRGDGLTGSFTVNPPNPGAPGFLGKGRLLWTGEHYLRFQNGEAWVKGGTNSPENWLGYTGFDNTSDGGSGPLTPDGLHAFPTHEDDWNPGDPDWNRTDPPGTNNGRAIIGALNYLESVGVNGIYFLPMNIGGDARDTWPYIGDIDPLGSPSNENKRFDISKLAQWDIVFQHAQRKGICLQIVLNEAETANKIELDNAELENERKLYYRELVARFGYHNAIVWNICEEYNLNLNLTAEGVLDFADYLAAIDPYEHPTTVHSAGNPFDPTSGPWQYFVGQPLIDLTSLQRQGSVDGWGEAIAAYRAESAALGQPLAVMVDEPGSPTRDVANYDEFRKRVIWDVLLSGGGGEWFISQNDHALEDFRNFDKIYRETTIARRFIEDNLPFTEMDPVNSLVSGETSTFDGAEVFVKPGSVYAIYYPSASNTGNLDLTGHNRAFRLRWFNPRTGLFQGSERTVQGGGILDMPAPPTSASNDWVALLTASQGCLADVNGNGDIESGDYFAWIDAFNNNDPIADQNQDGIVDPSDYFAWVDNYNIGCP